MILCGCSFKLQESESEDEILDEVDDDVEEELDHESEVQEQTEPIVTKPVEASPAPKETERQISKKERRKKELAELEAILADFGVNTKDKAEDEPSGNCLSTVLYETNHLILISGEHPFCKIYMICHRSSKFLLAVSSLC